MRINQLTFTRFIASILIVVYHYGQNVYPFNNENWNFVFKRASVGVSFFFILSGYVMIIAYYDYSKAFKISGQKYLQNRIARIYPAYLLALFFFALQVTPHIDKKGLLFNFLMLQAWIPGKALSCNAPGWSLCVELFFYILFPLLLNYIYRVRDFKILIIPIVTIWLLTQVALQLLLQSSFYKGFPSASHDLLFFNPLMHVNEFLVGNLAGLFFLNKLHSKQYNFDIHLLVLSIVLIIVLKFPIGLNYEDGLLAIVFVPIILMLSCNKGIISLLFRSKTCIFLGEISFGIYIFQVPIYLFVKGLIKNMIPEFQNSSMVFYIFLISLFSFSALSFMYFETPVRKKLQKMKFIH